MDGPSGGHRMSVPEEYAETAWQEYRNGKGTFGGHLVVTRAAFLAGWSAALVAADKPWREAIARETQDAIAEVLRSNGIVEHPTSPEQAEESIHSWRCGYPDRYDACDC